MPDDLEQSARQYRPYSCALYDALRDDPFYATLEASVEPPFDARAAMLCYYDYSIHEAAKFGRLVQKVTDQPVGISVWSVPLDAATQQQKTDLKNEMILRLMGRSALDTYKAIVSNMAKTTETVASDQDWYLSIAGLLPAFQGQGLGGDLIRPILAEADTAGAATYLETFVPRNMSFYRRLGFEPVGEFPEPVTNTTYYVMRRPTG